MDEVVKEFLLESYENLDKLDQVLVALEKDPRHKESLNSIFRTIHTVKGSCGFLGFVKLQRLSHVGENLLGKLRDGSLLLDLKITDALLALFDAIRKALSSIEGTGAEGADEFAPLIDRLAQLAEGKDGATPTPPVPTPPAATPPTPPTPPNNTTPTTPAPTPSAATRPETPAVPAAIPALIAAAKAESVEPEKTESKTGGMPEANIRVGVGLLDKLMNLVGELVLTRNEILVLSSSQSDPLALRAGQRLNLITSELQESVVKTRMQPIESVWSKLPRVVRDVAAAAGKRVRLEVSGQDTELDRSVIEAIKDPLTHILRNSIDHGIELPAKRLAAGKLEEGVLRLRALHEGGHVHIELDDDGGGIDLERVKRKAEQQGIISAAQAQSMSDEEAISLIFRPGFSTAEKVTQLSGRGVGMDVVKSNIKKIGGAVDIFTVHGKGTTIRIKIPLTLAIIPALIIRNGGERFAIPQISLLELVRLEGESARTGVEFVLGSPVYRLRGKLLPLVDLNRLFEKAPTAGLDAARTSEGHADRAIHIVVLEAEGLSFGLVVEEIDETQEIVVKPLGRHFKSIPLFAGATIMGDGRLALILDVLGIAQKAGVLGQARDLRRVAVAKAQMAAAPALERLLVFIVGGQHRMAIPLARLWRLERFAKSQVEREGSQEVAQYRGQIMPLLRLSRLHGLESWNESTEVEVQVVIYLEQERYVGLVVDQIVDIAEQRIEAEARSGRTGVLGAAVVQGRVTELLDLDHLRRTLTASWPA